MDNFSVFVKERTKYFNTLYFIICLVCLLKSSLSLSLSLSKNLVTTFRKIKKGRITYIKKKKKWDNTQKLFAIRQMWVNMLKLIGPQSQTYIVKKHELDDSAETAEKTLTFKLKLCIYVRS